MNGTEPVRYQALVTAIMSIVATLLAFGIINWTDVQVNALQASIVACLPLVVGMVNRILAETTRSKVTPLIDPRDNLLRSLVPMKPIGDDEGSP